MKSINAFENWLETNGDLSYDPYDVLGTPYALKARRLYYDKHPLGLPLITPLLLLEIFLPGWRRLWVEPNRFATADAQICLAFVNLSRAIGPARYLERAKVLGERMLEYSVPGYSGRCWGYPFDWQNQRGMWGKNTPFITATPYCYEAYCGLHAASGGKQYLDVAESIASFVFHDLHDNPAGPDASAASYSPHDDSQVINASAYRAWVLFDAAQRFQIAEYRKRAHENLNFVLQHQNANGSWFYANDPAGRYIDHFHTCFVLKNLCKIQLLESHPGVSAAIRRGYEFYRQELFDDAGLPKPFAIKPRTGIVRLEMYDFAESITLGVLLRNVIPEAYEHAKRLAGVLCRRYQLPEGYFVTRVYVGGIRHTLPFLRWPQSQLFLALTNLYIALHSSEPGVKTMQIHAASTA